jgi:hypothetical protein
MDVGKELAQAEKNGVDLTSPSVLKSIGTSKSSVDRMLTAYKFLFHNRPGVLEEKPDNLVCETVAYMPFIRRKMKEARLPDEEFDKLLNKVLTDGLSSKEIRQISRRLKAERQIQGQDVFRNEELKLDDKSHSLVSVEKAVDLLDYVLEQALRTNTRGEIGSAIGKKIYNLTVKMNGVIDE